MLCIKYNNIKPYGIVFELELIRISQSINPCL